MVFARTCYDHLAGVVAVGLTNAMVDRGDIEFVDTAATITPQGRAHLAAMGVSDASSNRQEVRRCLDWSERQPHLAGAIPANLLNHMLGQRWFIRRPSNRALELTTTGRDELADHFNYVAP